MDKLIKAAIPFSVAYIAATFLLEDQIAALLKDRAPLLWVTAALAVFNMAVLLTSLLRRITVSVILLNLVQIALFLRLHIYIHEILGPSHYSSPSPALPDWLTYVGLHLLNAVDLPDIMDAYAVEALFFEKADLLSHQGDLAGIALFCMQLTIALFVGTAIFKKMFARDPSDKTEPEGKGRWIWMGGLLAALAGMNFLGWQNGWEPTYYLSFPAENLLLALDIGDGLQIFDWRLLPPHMDMALAAVAVIFRLIIIWYALLLLHQLHLRISSTLQSVDELARICLSPEHALEDRLVAIKKLEELGTFADSAVPHLVNALADSNEEIRRAASGALEEIDAEWTQSDKARNTLPDLIKHLLNKDGHIRIAAADALERLDPQWPEAEAAHSVIPNLVNALFEKENGVRIAGADVLGAIGPSAAKAVPHLAKALSTPDKVFRVSVAEALGRMGPVAEESAPSLIKILADGEEVADAAAESLGKMGPGAILNLVEALRENDGNIRNGAALALDTIDPEWRESDIARDAVGRFVNIMGDSFSSKRGGAAEALGIIGSAEVIPHLIHVLADGEGDVRIAAVQALERIDTDWQQSDTARQTIPHLIKSLIDNDPNIRTAATEALGKINPEWQQSAIARKAIPQFAKALSNTLPTVRSAAAGALGAIGPAAAKALPHLLKTLADKEGEVRQEVADALEKVEPKWRQSKSASHIAPRLIKSLEDVDWQVRNAVADALGGMGPAYAKIIPNLAKLLIDSDKRVRNTAIGSLEKIDPKWRESEHLHKALPHLLKALGDGKWIVRMAAVDALTEIGPSLGKITAPHLAKALKDSVIDVQHAAKEALEKIDPTGKLREQEAEEGRYVLSATEKALGEINPASAEAIPHLVKKLIDSDRSVRKAAREELGKISPKWPQSKVARSVIPYMLKEGLADSRWAVRSASAKALGEFGPAVAKVAGPRLKKAMLMDSSVDVQSAARKALKRLKLET